MDIDRKSGGVSCRRNGIPAGEAIRPSPGYLGLFVRMIDALRRLGAAAPQGVTGKRDWRIPATGIASAAAIADWEAPPFGIREKLVRLDCREADPEKRHVVGMTWCRRLHRGPRFMVRSPTG